MGCYHAATSLLVALISWHYFYSHWVLRRGWFKPCSFKKHSVPYMIEVVLTNILVQGGVIYPYINGFLYGSCLPPVLSSYDVEVVVIYGVS